MKAFIIFRDRVTYGIRCANALYHAGLEVIIVDQGSTWPRALSWLHGREMAGLTVLRRGGGHPRELWGWPPFREACGDGRYLVTDPDVVPSDCCPPDWPARLTGLLAAYPDAPKAGLGLRTDNLPEHYSRRDQVIAWEAQFRTAETEDGVYRAGIDTTLAVYQPLAERGGHVIDGALRTGYPYVADHLAWHEDLARPGPEIAYYYAHAEPGITHWAPGGVSAWGD